MRITLGSLFDGAGTCPFAAQQYGIDTLWTSEIEPFPLSVTKVRFPDAKQLGDITQITGSKIDPVDVWQQYASPVWMDIRQSDTLQRKSARAEKDERHIAPLQLQVIQRCIELWTNLNDIVLDPFAGIGSVPYVALGLGRRGIGIELKESYYQQAVLNCRNAAEAVQPVGTERDYDDFDTDVPEVEITSATPNQEMTPPMNPVSVDKSRSDWLDALLEG
ncbi:MAG: hypothetical protein LBR74_10100 [Eubacterium sp.]|jgi:hypothetical protein|nr:hypothetical protein [Eubacterium sp.]